MTSPRYALLLICLLAGCGQATTDIPQDAAAEQVADASVAVDEDGEEVAIVDADTDMDADVDIDPDADVPAQTEQTDDGVQPTCTEAPLATYLFTLVDEHALTVDGCGRFDPQLAAAFDALLSEAPHSDGARLRERLLSGPADAGEPVSIAGTTAWLYTACQAHRCDSTRLALLYVPATSTMVGKLLLDGRVHWLGAPDDALREVLDARVRMQPEQSMDGEGS